MSKLKVLITGGASGLGRALVFHYLKQGAEVVVLDNDREGLSVLKKDPLLREAVGALRTARVDLAGLRADRLGAELHAVLHEGAPFGVVVLNAGISNSDDFLQTDRDLDERMLAVNLIGHMQLVKALLARGRIAHRGRLGLVASASVFLPFPIAIAYAASKAAVHGLAHVLAPYLRGEKISVSCVYPGPIKTPHAEKYYERFNEGRGSAPDAVARRIARGLKNRRREILPDFAAWLFSTLASVSPRLLGWIMHRKFREHMYRIPDPMGPGGDR